MTDVEVICNWMEPKLVNDKFSEEAWESVMAATLDGNPLPATPKGWWGWVCVYEHGDKPELRPACLSLDRLWKAEERLSPGQRLNYSQKLISMWPWHATAEQKIKVLAAVIREETGAGV